MALEKTYTCDLCGDVIDGPVYGIVRVGRRDSFMAGEPPIEHVHPRCLRRLVKRWEE